ncbi:MAG: glutamate synthase large subunit [Candidatus Ancillula sp.]|nr:glutamate synthase large subunit [Candidatus Ancillula sp.]
MVDDAYRRTAQSGLYNADYEHDACGLGFVATLKKKPTRKIVEAGLEVLLNLDHRGAVGAEENSGDGAGILVSIPDRFLRKQFAKLGVELPEQGYYAAGIAFTSRDEKLAEKQRLDFEKVAIKEGLKVLGWRKVEVDDSQLGPTARGSCPSFSQVVVIDQLYNLGSIELDRITYRVRNIARQTLGLYFASLSSRTITYKGMLTTKQLPEFFLDLQDDTFEAKIALVHSRFSTNTFPSWELAQPLRNIAHNGEINTIRGNRNWFSAREGLLNTSMLEGRVGGSFKDLLPILTPGASDSGSFDEVLELLHLSGRSLPHSVLMMIPEAFENWQDSENDALKAFYEYNSTLIEPWDGPVALSFTDGDLIGALLDRNGLRPGRYMITDELVVMASEAGVLNVDGQKVAKKGRLEPGVMLLVDTNDGRVIENDEVKEQLAGLHPYRKWLDESSVKLADLPHREHIMFPAASVHRRQRAFGYTEEDIKLILTPMANTGKEPLGAMGTDTPLAVLSKRPRLLFDYFTQDFAQVTNPPLDSIREKIVTSLASAIGPEPNLLEDIQNHAMKLLLPFPVINNDELAKIQRIARDEKVGGHFKSVVIRGLFSVADSKSSGKNPIEKRLKEIFDEVDEAIEDGTNFIILSDRDSNRDWAPIPSLLLTAAVQHHLLRNQTRTKISMLVEAGDVRETHHVALLIAYGAAAVNPYLAMETIENLARSNFLEVDAQTATQNLILALGNGVLKIMSKMGISTIMSYRGAQVFGAVGLSKEFVDKYFTGTTSALGGIGLDIITEEVLERHLAGYPKVLTSSAGEQLNTGGEYKWRKAGEEHLFDPESIFFLQQSTSIGGAQGYKLFKKFSDKIDAVSGRLMTIRSLFRLKLAPELGREVVDLDEVESVEKILKRFSTGAMSYGSISREAHETLAIAMNSIGARSNSGEGGEEIDRIYSKERRSKIKQVASARFGVTSEYLVSATDIQIKLAQGAKPGEGGHLPGEKVYPWIAEVRHSTPGIDLVSPPPHHDIYSIEDLAQLIHDLKMANPDARIHVKLVAEYGVGTIAAGVSKAHADVILISGHDGGTGAAPLSSIKHAGTAWEIGLAQTQQTLVQNDLRDRVTLQCDGQLKTGRDVIIAALLGAEEFGFATAPLVVEGCVMMRVCNKNTCPVGIATQDENLRKNFHGKSEHVVNYFTFVAQQVREILASLGFRTLDEIIGHSDILDKRAVVDNFKANQLNLEPIFELPKNNLRTNAQFIKSKEQKHAIEDSLDALLMQKVNFEDLKTHAQTITSRIRNVDRSFGTLIGFEVTKRYNFGHSSSGILPDNALTIALEGVGGQSLGAFLPSGVTINLLGETNDYAAKGLSGGKLVVRANTSGDFDPHQNVVAGNVLGFGATSGVAYFHGLVGERFAVRNSGAVFVCEGTGDHALEYMTGGTAVILGHTGKNIGAGFLGGVAYVLDLNEQLINEEARNQDLLELESLEKLPVEQQLKVRKLLDDYAKCTSSHFAVDLLDNWDKTTSNITRIIPKKYKELTEMKH